MRFTTTPRMNDGPGVVRAYKLLTRVERAFRAFKVVDLEIVATATPLQARALALLGLTPASVQAELRSLGHAQLSTAGPSNFGLHASPAGRTHRRTEPVLDIAGQGRLADPARGRLQRAIEQPGRVGGREWRPVGQ